MSVTPRAQRARCVSLSAAVLFLTTGAAWPQVPEYGSGRLDHFPYQPNLETWQRMDACRLQAQERYPNWTQEDAEARAEATQLCLKSGKLPPVTPLGPSTWPPGPAPEIGSTTPK
jgi:hypothetical protein